MKTLAIIIIRIIVLFIVGSIISSIAYLVGITVLSLIGLCFTWFIIGVCFIGFLTEIMKEYDKGK